MIALPAELTYVNGLLVAVPTLALTNVTSPYEGREQEE